MSYLLLPSVPSSLLCIPGSRSSYCICACRLLVSRYNRLYSVFASCWLYCASCWSCRCDGNVTASGGQHRSLPRTDVLYPVRPPAWSARDFVEGARGSTRRRRAWERPRRRGAGSHTSLTAAATARRGEPHERGINSDGDAKSHTGKSGGPRGVDAGRGWVLTATAAWGKSSTAGRVTRRPLPRPRRPPRPPPPWRRGRQTVRGRLPSRDATRQWRRPDATGAGPPQRGVCRVSAATTRRGVAV